MADKYGEPRIRAWNGFVYVIRDILNDDGRPSGKCEYATMVLDHADWRPCQEGVMYVDIKPFVGPVEANG